MAKRRVALIALDSITPIMVDRFMAEGRLPNLERMRRQGWSAEILPTWPATTPAGWTTVATGAWPSTHGIEGFAVHVEGEPLDKKNHSCLSDRVRAEFIWQTAERAGKRSTLLKYPLSWPFTAGDLVTQVDGAGGWGGLKCAFDLIHSGSWDTAAAAAASGQRATQVVSQEWITRDSDTMDEESVQPLPVREAGPWTNLPPGTLPLWETSLTLRHRAAAAGTEVHLLAVRAGSRESLLVAGQRDAAAASQAGVGQWTGWLQVPVSTPEGETSGHVRFKVLAFDAGARRLRLYQTQVHRDSGYTRPAPLATELLEAAGPFVEWTEGYERLKGWIDDPTQLEIYEQHVEWMGRATEFLLRRHPWDLFMTEVHFLDMAYHLYWGTVNPEHPDYSAEKAPGYWDLLGRVHELADSFVGQVRKAAGEEALILVLGDHGHDLYHSSLLANNLLLREGLLALYQDRRSGVPRIDWGRTRAYASSYRVYVNVAGRDPQGIVKQDEYDGIQERIIQALYDVRDARTGRHPVRLAVRREDSRAFGLYGGSMGDVVLAMAPGYQTRSTITVPAEAWLGGRVQPERVPVLKVNRLFEEFSGDHDTSLPLTHSIRTLIYADGPGVKPGGRRVPVRLVDVAPTVCRYLDIPFPADCEGSPIWEAFAD